MSTNLKGALNEGNIHRLDAMAQAVKLGDVLALTPRAIYNTAVTGTNSRIELPEAAKAIAVLAAYDITNGLGMIPAEMGATLAAEEIGVFGNGDLAFRAADAIAAADVLYLSPDADVEEFEIVAVAASAAPLPANKRAWLLLEVEILTGIDLQVLNGAEINARGATPGDNTCNLNAAGTSVVFNAADVVTGTCRIKALVNRSQNLTTKLALTTGF